MGSSGSGPVTLAIVLLVAAAVAVLAGWMAGRGNQRRGVIVGAIGFVVLGGAGLAMFGAPHGDTVRGPAARFTVAPTPMPSIAPVTASKRGGGTYEAARKAPSVGARDIMMLWTLPAGERVAFCTDTMKHFANDCRDVAAAMGEMSRPALPEKMAATLARAVRTDLANRDTAVLADHAVEAAMPGHPDQMYAYPSPGGTDATVYWCRGGNEQATFDRANRVALALATSAGLKLDKGVVIGRVLLIGLDKAAQGGAMPSLGDGDTVRADMGATATTTMLGLIQAKAQVMPTPRGAPARPGTIALFVCA